MRKKILQKLLQIKNARICTNYHFLHDNTLHVDTILSVAIFPEDVYSLKKIIQLLHNYEIAYLVIGNGSKVLFSEKIVKKIVIFLKHNFSTISCDGKSIYATSGCNISHFIHFALKNQKGGLEKLIGIPATIGGAIYHNASAHQVAISDYIEKIDFLDGDGEFQSLKKEDANFSYRYSIFQKQKKWIIIGALFLLPDVEIQNAQSLIAEALAYRKLHQPIPLNTCGSLFINPSQCKAYEILKNIPDELKMTSKVMLSPKHQNFLINYQNATADEIISFIQNIQKYVNETFQIHLELELEIL